MGTYIPTYNTLVKSIIVDEDYFRLRRPRRTVKLLYNSKIYMKVILILT